MSQIGMILPVTRTLGPSPTRRYGSRHLSNHISVVGYVNIRRFHNPVCHADSRAVAQDDGYVTLERVETGTDRGSSIRRVPGNHARSANSVYASGDGVGASILHGQDDVASVCRCIHVSRHIHTDSGQYRRPQLFYLTNSSNTASA